VHKPVRRSSQLDHEISNVSHPQCTDACAYHGVPHGRPSAVPSSEVESSNDASSSSSEEEEQEDESAVQDRREWQQYTLRDLRDWGRDFDGVADVANDETVNKIELIDTFVALGVPLPGTDGQPTMEDHVREYRARDTDASLRERQARAKEVIERTQKRQAAHAVELLNDLEPKRYRMESAAPPPPAAAAASSSSYFPPPQQQYHHHQQQQAYDLPPVGLSSQALAEFFEYRARVRSSAFLPAPLPAPLPAAAAAASYPSSASAAAASAPSSSAPREVQSDPSLCIVCDTNKRSVVFQSCGHFICCRDCVEQIRRNSGLCPLCRSKFGFKTMITGVKF